MLSHLPLRGRKDLRIAVRHRRRIAFAFLYAVLAIIPLPVMAESVDAPDSAAQATSASGPMAAPTAVPTANPTAIVAISADPVSAAVRLIDGRTVRGTIDAQSTVDRLCLRQSRAGILMRSWFDWSIIMAADVGGTELTVAEFRGVAETVATSFSSTPFRDAGGRIMSGTIELHPSQAILSSADVRESAKKRRVRSLYIEAVVANWDADVESDGIRLLLVPLDSAGQPLPVSGRIDLKLIAESYAPFGERRSIGVFKQAFPVIGSWSQTVTMRDFDDFGAVYEFPFRAIHPESDWNISWYGLATARLVVPGEGVFAASDDTVSFRPYSLIRDRLQHREQVRFFVDETTTLIPVDSRRNRPGRPNFGTPTINGSGL